MAIVKWQIWVLASLAPESMHLTPTLHSLLRSNMFVIDETDIGEHDLYLWTRSIPNSEPLVTDSAELLQASLRDLSLENLGHGRAERISSGLPMHAHFLFSYSTIRLSKVSSPGRKRVDGWRKLRGITLMEPLIPWKETLGWEFFPMKEIGMRDFPP